MIEEGGKEGTGAEIHLVERKSVNNDQSLGCPHLLGAHTWCVPISGPVGGGSQALRLSLGVGAGERQLERELFSVFLQK